MANAFQLYKVSAQLDDVLERAIDEETGELLDEQLLELLGQLQMEKDELVHECILEYKNLIAEAEAVKAEKMNLAKRQSMKERNAETLKKYVETALGGEKISTSQYSVSYRKSESVEYSGNIEDLPVDCIKVEKSLKKTELKKHLKAGEQIENASLVVKNNMSIK